MVERSPLGVFYVLYYCGESILQTIAALALYFLQKPFPLKGYMGVKVVK